ncbi:DUF2441 domain-containing protein [Pectinatus haikarae]|uniref:DUF2441 domain-containing protein n=1 Tax=Pectinatus haikarae TaxID=349096 RepID=UPI0018C7739B|nr:DUF2441 domain-containing protein [Pectinatus haikarae]
MEHIQDKIFYHIRVVTTKEIPFSLSKTYTFGKKLNNYYSFYESMSNQTIPQLANEYIRYAQEMIFEEMRQKDFPSLPSRKTCLWLIPNSENLSQALVFWFKQMYNPTMSSLKILKFSCTGNIHYANQKYLTLNINDVKLLREDAVKYWQGDNASCDNIDTEVLFEGTAKVIEIRDPFTINF